MGVDTASRRFCPLCDAETDASLCPKDGTATLPCSINTGGDGPGVVPGTVFAGRYRIDRVIGAGGFGRVFAATQVSMGREVAIKVLLDKRLGSREHVRRFYREARTSSRLDSQHVVRMYDFGVDEQSGTPYLVMEYLQGRTLRQLLTGCAALPPRQAACIAGQVALALAEALDAGIVHRDLKPANIFLQKARGGREIVKVMDFGIAKMLRRDDEDTGESLTAAGTTMGTPTYMSPEQAMAEKVDFRSDLFSLGCILHEMLTGRLAYEAEDKVSLLLKRVSGEPPAPPELLPGSHAMPPALAVLHKALLAKRRDQRPATCQVVAQICEAVERGDEVDAEAMLIDARTRDLSEAAFRATAAPSPEHLQEMMPSTGVRTTIEATEPRVPPPAQPPEESSAAAPKTAPERAVAAAATATVIEDTVAETPAAQQDKATRIEATITGPPSPSLRTRATALQDLPSETQVESSDGWTSPEMASAERASLRRAARPPSRTGVWIGVLVVLLLAGAAIAALVVTGLGGETAPAARTEAAPAPAPAESTAAPAPAPGAPPAKPAVPERPPAEPAQADAQVVIRSTPKGAVVLRGDEELCRTPCDLELPPEEEPVKLSVERSGYRPTEIEISLTPGAGIVREVRLRRARTVKRQPAVEADPTPRGAEPAGEKPAPAARPEQDDAPPAPARRLRRIRPTR